jgi:antitoxin component YwqK of YwqJK toxin-antitoxin module/tetratricopeptide (TPR) repeat protein
MIRYLLLAISVALTLAVNAQKIPLINSGEVIERATALYDSGKYDDAIAKFLTVPKRDTNYVYMLSELALAYTANKQYEKAIAVCEEALAKPSLYKAHLLKSQAIATDKKGDFDKSVVLFNKAIEQYPFDVSFVYNLGITYYNHKDYDKAIDCFFKVLNVNPFHAGSHLNLGRIAVGQGRKTHAMFSFGMYLGVSNTDNSVLVYADKFLSNQIQDESTLPAIGTNGCEKLDQIIRAKVAMEEKFKTKTGVSAPVVKQYEMFFEQLGIINTSTDDRWVNYYLPIYKAIKESNMMEPFLFHILASADNDVVKKWRKKNEKSLNSFYTVANVEMKKKREMLNAPQAGFDKPIPAWYDDSNRLDALGVEQGEKRMGHWVYFHNNSERSAEGHYNNNGDKIGVWKYYLNTGALKSLENYDNGEVTLYYPDGTKRQHFFLKSGEIDGIVELYNRCGGLREKLVYKAGKRNGKGQSFYPNGKTDMSYEYIDDKGTGEFLGYYESGQLFNKTIYKNDLREGPYVEYHANGKVKIKGNYINNKSEGEWNYYYSNGKPEKTGHFKAGNSVDEWTFYNTHGVVIEKRKLNAASEFHGDDIFYADGKASAVKTYKNDVLVKVVYYNPEGKEIGKSENNNGTFTTKSYYTHGQLSAEGAYKKGLPEGTWKYYQPEGRKFSEYTYVNGLVQGEAVEYFRNGQKKYIFKYVDDRLHGYFQEFYPNGKIKEEGWMQDGERQQQWLAYYPDGVVESDAFYLNGELTGEYTEYNTDGKIGAVTVYDNGYIENLTNYNAKGEAISRKRKEDTKQVYETFFASKKPESKFEIQCGNYTGAATRWFPDGSLFYTYGMLGGKRHGMYKYHELNGQLSHEVLYLNGQREGIWKSYYSNGQLDYQGKYVQGNSDSTWTFYYMHGKVSSTIEYAKDERHGIARYNSAEGSPVLEKLYSEGDLIAYRAADAAGAFGAWIPFTATTTEIKATFPNGTTAIEEHYKDGALDGAKRIYFANGKLYSEYNYKYGDYEGAYAIYYPSGKIREKGEYKDDEFHGVVEEYNEDGSLLKLETFQRGIRNGKAVVNKKGAKSQTINFWWGIPE